MLTRLRQLCCHPWLLRASDEYRDNYVELEENAEEADSALQNLSEEEELARAEVAQGPVWVDEVRKKLEERYASMVAENDDADDNDFVSADRTVFRKSDSRSRVAQYVSNHMPKSASQLANILSVSPLVERLKYDVDSRRTMYRWNPDGATSRRVRRTAASSHGPPSSSLSHVPSRGQPFHSLPSIRIL